MVAIPATKKNVTQVPYSVFASNNRVPSFHNIPVMFLDCAIWSERRYEFMTKMRIGNNINLGVHK